MKFTVVWHPDAERELTQIWLGARDRSRITEAVETIDSRLRANPEQCGESRADGRRILFVEPLGAVFRALREDQQVVVIRIWRFRT